MRINDGRSKTTRRATLFAGLLFAATVPEWNAAMEYSSAPEAPTAKAVAQFDQQAALAQLRKQIAGHEAEPAEAVFKNVTALKGVPAGRLLAVMSMGFSRSLGVDCTHCHTVDRWESDEKAPKQIARGMWTMTNAINTEQLRQIDGLKGRNAIVNCTTCHRGQLKPALALGEAAS